MYKIKTIIRRFFTRILEIHRPGSYPFITSDGFKSFADHIYDESFDFKAIDVLKNDIIFVRTNQLESFFKNKHEAINNPYILLTHNDDLSLDEKIAEHLSDEKIIHWFGENVTFEHPKLTPLPIGIYSRHYNKDNVIANSIRNYSNLYVSSSPSSNGESTNKLAKIFFSFSLITNTEGRTEVLNILKNIHFAEGPEKMLSRDKHIEELSKYMFVVSPPGNGLDCHRTWEALCLKVVPIVEKSPATLYWKNIGLPLYLIDSWNDLEKLSPEKLSEIYKSLEKDFSTDKIFITYWLNEINKHKI